MGVPHFTELRAWQLSNRLRIEVYRFTGIPPATEDRRFCDDVRASSRSICANISEGFGRFTHGEFAHFVNIARGSLSETQDHLVVAGERNYVSTQKFEELWELSIEAMRAVNGLYSYLTNSPTPKRGRERNRKTPTGPH